MKSLNNNKDYGLEKTNFSSLGSTDLKVVSVEECNLYLDKFELSDEKVIEIRNYLIGIIDKSINLYLEDFE